MANIREHLQGPNKPALRLHPRRLGHVNLFVSDLEKSMDFYENVAGFHEIFREADIQAGFLSNGNTHHDFGLIQTSDVDRVDKNGKVLIAASQRGRYPGLNHLGFEMESEQQLVNVHSEFKRLGIDGMRTVDHGLARSVYMTDPDGNTIEFYADTVDDWRSFWKDNLGKTVTQGWVPDPSSASTVSHYPLDAQRDTKATTPLQSRHVFAATLNTEDLAPMVGFYRDIVGLQVTRGSADADICAMGTSIEHECLILRRVPRRTSALATIHVEVASQQDLKRAHERLKESRVAVETGDSTLEVIDPDGFPVHFVRRS